MVVGHSAASTLAWLAADARPQRVAKVTFIGGFPNADGASYADFFPVVDEAMPFPGWEPFEGADSADLDQEMKARHRRRRDPRARRCEQGCRAAVRRASLRRPGGPGVPGVHSGRCASSGSTPASVPELAKAKRLELVDIATGHWPMVSARPSSPGSSPPRPRPRRDGSDRTVHRSAEVRRWGILPNSGALQHSAARIRSVRGVAHEPS